MKHVVEVARTFPQEQFSEKTCARNADVPIPQSVVVVPVSLF